MNNLVSNKLITDTIQRLSVVQICNKSNHELVIISEEWIKAFKDWPAKRFNQCVDYCLKKTNYIPTIKEMYEAFDEVDTNNACNNYLRLNAPELNDKVSKGQAKRNALACRVTVMSAQKNIPFLAADELSNCIIKSLPYPELYEELKDVVFMFYEKSKTRDK